MLYVGAGMHTAAPGADKLLFDAGFGAAKSEPDAVALRGGAGLAKS
jgi:hypothetical protein